MPYLQMDPLVQRARPARIGGEILDERGDAWIAPRAAEIRPDFRERLFTKIAADEGQRVDQLDESVREHDQQRGRVLQPEAELLEQPRLVEVDTHPAAVLVDLRPQHVEEPRVLGVRDREMAPGL